MDTSSPDPLQSPMPTSDDEQAQVVIEDTVEPTKKSLKKLRWVALVGVLVTLVLGVGVYVVLSRQHPPRSDTVEVVDHETVTTPMAASPTVARDGSDAVEISSALMSEYPDTYSTRVVEADGSAPSVEVIDSNNQVVWSVNVPDLYVDYTHESEFLTGYLYVIRRVGYEGYPDEDWADELWRYGADDSKIRLYSTQGLDFRTRPDHSYVAIRLWGAAGDQVVLKHVPTGEEIIYTKADIDPAARDEMSMNLIDWGPGGALRGNLALTAYPELLFTLTVDGAVETYQYPEEGFRFVLNPEDLWVAYTSEPIFFETGAYEEYMADDPSIILYVYHMETRETRKVAESIAESFTYEWLDGETLSYRAGEAETAEQYVLD